MDTPQRACTSCTKQPGGKTKFGCHECRCPRERFSDLTYDIEAGRRSRKSIEKGRALLRKILNDAERDRASMELGIVADKEGLENPVDPTNIDLTLYMPPEMLHQDSRVCAVTS